MKVQRHDEDEPAIDVRKAVEWLLIFAVFVALLAVLYTGGSY